MFIFNGFFYINNKPLTDNSIYIESMGFKGYVDTKSNCIEDLANKYPNIKFLYIDYVFYNWYIEKMDTTIFFKNKQYIDNVRVKEDKPITEFPKYIILKIKNFGFSEYGKLNNKGIMSDYFELFDRKFLLQIKS